MESRYTDETPVRCKACGWQGQAKDCRHGYAAVPPDDVEPMDYCPECGAAEPIPIEQEPATV